MIKVISLGVVGVLSSTLAFGMGSGPQLKKRELPLDPKKTYITSQIRFPGKDKDPEVLFANLSASDALSVCPLETLPADLGLAVNQLVTKVRDAVSRLKAAQGPDCKALQNQLDASQGQIGTALQNQFLLGGSVSESGSQNAINFQTQQASAVNSFLLTVNGMVNRECINNLDDKIQIQRLLGQVITLGGLFMGGWQGLGVAMGGQLIGNIPIFRSEMDKALEVFQKYDEVNERGSFLCLYRNMQKVSTLLFATEEDETIHGLDLSFKTGPARITQDSIDQIQAKSPDLLEDVAMLYEIHKTSTELVQEMLKPEIFDKSPYELFQSVVKWCGKTPVHGLKALGAHPAASLKSIEGTLASLQASCVQLNTFQWQPESQDHLEKFLRKIYWEVVTLREYYVSMKGSTESPFGEVAKTWESLKYFETLKKSFELYRNSKTGNQARLNYYRMTKDLGKGLARSSFKKLIKENSDTLYKKRCFSSSYSHALPLRKRALKAMIDLCQTLDPTLVRLYIDDPLHQDLYEQWADSCVGPKSRLCKKLVGSEEQFTLIDDPEYQIYFYSLCGNEMLGPPDPGQKKLEEEEFEEMCELPTSKSPPPASPTRAFPY